MRLYFNPGACSLSPHIVLREAGLAFDLEHVDLKTKKTKDGGDFLRINPKGQVPVLRLDNGELLTEGPAIVQYIADRKPEAGLIPAAGTMERYRVQEWLGRSDNAEGKVEKAADGRRRRFGGETRQTLQVELERRVEGHGPIDERTRTARDGRHQT